VLLLAYADILFTSAESERPETRTYSYRSVPESSTIVYRLINNGILVIVYIDKNADHVSMEFWQSACVVNSYASE